MVEKSLVKILSSFIFNSTICCILQPKDGLMKIYRIGLASYGMSGQVFHAPLIHIQKGLQLAAILERNRRLSATRFPATKIVTRYEELLDDPEIDMVVVNLPDPLHYDMARKALDSGKHVIVEKPFVRQSKQGRELIELANRRELLLSVFHNRRWDGDFLTVRRILENGILGRLVEYEAHFDRYRNYIREDTWKEKSGSGSTLYNLGSHLIDQAIMLFGKPDHVFAEIRILRDGGKVDDAFTLLLGYADVRVTLKSSYLVKEPGPRYLLHGTEGSYIKYGTDPQEEALKKGDRPPGKDWGKEPESDWGILSTEKGNRKFHGKYETLPGRYQDYYANIYQALNRKSPPEVTAEQANLVIRVIEAAFESHESGCRVQI
jgi:predicted dehydrogenase